MKLMKIKNSATSIQMINCSEIFETEYDSSMHKQNLHFKMEWATHLSVFLMHLEIKVYKYIK